MKVPENLICGGLLIVIGLFIRYHIGRRRFNRRGVGGLQHFPTYNRFIVTVMVESVIHFIATLSLWAGIFILAITGFNHLFKF